MVIEDYEAKDSVELSLVAGQLVIVLNEVDEEWAKGQRFGDEQVVGLFPLRCTQELDAEQVEAEKERALRLKTQLQLAASKEKQAALAKVSEGQMIFIIYLHRCCCRCCLCIVL